jgi:cyclic pyranopterin phosphate synthase
MVPNTLASPRKLPVIRPLTDANHRKITYLRVSLTDRCNYRCTYCMPAEGVSLVPKEDILTFEELVRLAHVFAGLGVKRLRLTGGEPTLRQRVVDLVARLKAVPGIEELVMTTNGHRLPEMAAPLMAAGLSSVNVSLDSLDANTFSALTRRGDLTRVLAGIDAARAAGLRVKINAVPLRGQNDVEVPALCAYAWERGIVPRFIEHMPMSEGDFYDTEHLIAAAEIRARVEAQFGPLEAVGGDTGSGPARYHRLVADPTRRFGIISAMTEHFCDTCNRVRLSARGELQPCLGYDDGTDLRAILRSGGSDADLTAAIFSALAGKRDGHQFLVSGQGGPEKHMVSIGG